MQITIQQYQQGRQIVDDAICFTPPGKMVEWGFIHKSLELIGVPSKLAGHLLLTPYDQLPS